MTYVEALGHTPAQLLLMADAHKRKRARDASAQLNVIFSAFAPSWAKDGQRVIKRLSKRLEKMADDYGERE